MAKELPPEPEWRGVSGLRIVVPHGRPDVMLVEIKTLYGPVRLSIPQEHCAESRPIDCRRTREARARPVTFIADGANAMPLRESRKAAGESGLCGLSSARGYRTARQRCLPGEGLHSSHL